MDIPIINMRYNCFDDGKIRESRKYAVTITDIIPFNNIDIDTKLQWQSEVTSCYWLYSPETDVFIKAANDDGEEEIFARTKDNGWFGINGFLNCGRLDVDGSLTKIMNSNKS